jgi:uncharacterized protein YjdB
MKTWKYRAVLGVVAIVVLSFAFIGCGDKDGDTKVHVTNVTLADTLRLTVGGTPGTLTATVLPSDANEKAVTWKSEPTGKVGINPGSGGTATITALEAGETTITVTTVDGGKTATCSVTVLPRVDPGAVERVDLNKNETTLLVGGTETLIVQVMPATVPNRSVTWSSSDDEIADVTQNGLVTARGVGTATIKATSNADIMKYAECVVTVNPILVTGVNVTPTTLSLEVGKRGRLSAQVLPLSATFREVTWSSSDETKATVSNGPTDDDPGALPAGTVTAVAESDTPVIITATTEGLKADGEHATAICTVTVTPAMPEVDGMVWIPPGSFMMGSPQALAVYTSELPQHQVTLSKGFYMTEIAVPQALYMQITGLNPSYFVPQMDEMLAHWPVDGITWFDAVEFCIKLTETIPALSQVYTMTGRTPATGYPITTATVTVNWNATGFRLPTEAEWEYACRAGTTTNYNTGSNYVTIDEVNFDDGTDDAWWQTIPGGPDPDYPQWPWIIYPPNDWGLYDMHGNVEEWCWDWFAMYTAGAVTDPHVDSPSATIGNYRIARGGAFLDEADDVRSASRNGWGPGTQHTNLEAFPYGLPWMGFRIVLPYSDEILNWSAKAVGERSSKAQMQTSLQEYSKMKAQMKAQTKMQGAKNLLKGKLQSIQIKEKKLNVSPVKPQALRRKSVFE